MATSLLTAEEAPGRSPAHIATDRQFPSIHDHDVANAEPLVIYETARAVKNGCHGDRLSSPVLTSKVVEWLLADAATAPTAARARATLLAAAAVQQVLVRHAGGRDRQSLSAVERWSLDHAVECFEQAQGVDLVALGRALRRLHAANPLGARVATLRLFGGVAEAEIAVLLGLDDGQAKQQWKLARARLHQCDLRRRGD